VNALAASGWALGAALGLSCLELRRRLELVARAEHELRGPLTAVVLGAEALARAVRSATPAEGRERRRLAPEEGGAGTPAAVREPDQAVAALESEVGRLRLSLEDLRAARAGRRAAPRPETLSLEEAVRASAESWAPPARIAGGEVSLDWRAGPVTLEADGRRLAQALGNVLANAVEHGDGRVRVTGRRSEVGVRVEVRDGGPGFASTSAPDRTAGHGRGLAVAALAAREAGGQLRVESGADGATVALELPAVER
jgi:signal transduction histidine kinase